MVDPATREETPPQAPPRSTAVHWLATATALAAVVALAATLAPASAAGPVADGPHAVPASAAPDPGRALYPLDCGGLPTKVQQSFSADLTGYGTIATIAAASCLSGVGTPPDGLYVLKAGTAAGRPRIAAVLINPGQQLTVRKVSVESNGDIVAAVDGYSSANVPRCCADVHETFTWTPHDGGYLRTVSFPDESV